jgi:hypothetical protein
LEFWNYYKIPIFGNDFSFQNSKNPNFQIWNLFQILQSGFSRSEVDAELPLALQKNDFKRVLFRCSRRDMLRGLARDQVTAKTTKSKFGILEYYEKFLTLFQKFRTLFQIFVPSVVSLRA